MKKNKLDLSGALFWAATGIFVLFLAFMYGYSVFSYKITVDEWEHMQASWMIGQGMVPFRDFFEHHHPLMWYLTAPFLMNSPSLLAFNGTRLMTLVVFAANCGWIYGIARLLSGRKAASFLSMFFYMVSYITIAKFADFRPDHLMICMMLGGVWFLLKYFEKQRSLDLNVSFFLFFLSFCFLQKVILFFLPLGLLFLVLLWDKRISFKAVFTACLLPFVCTVAYGVYLWMTNSFTDYFELNWLLNKAWFRDYEESTPFFCQLYVWGGLAAAVVYAFRNEDWRSRFFFTLIILYFAVWFAGPRPYITYYLPIIPFLAISWGFLMDKYFVSKMGRRWIGFLLIGYFFVEGICYFEIYFEGKHPSYYPMSYVLSAMKPDERVVSFSPSFLVPFHQPVSYYWFGLGRGAFWDHMLFQRRPLPDLNQAMLDEKTRFVRIGFVYNQQYTDNTDTSQIAYQPDEKILNQFYRKTFYPFIYERKPNSIK